jgi:F-type H+-transporting ATPase subunit epsilon
MKITVLTPDRQIFSGEITSVKVPGTLGEFQVLKNHAPIVSSLEAGKVTLVTAGGEHRIFDEESGVIKTVTDPGKKVTFQIGGGFIEVLNNEVSLLVRGVKTLAKA